MHFLIYEEPPVVNQTSTKKYVGVQPPPSFTMCQTRSVCMIDERECKEKNGGVEVRALELVCALMGLVTKRDLPPFEKSTRKEESEFLATHVQVTQAWQLPWKLHSLRANQ